MQSYYGIQYLVPNVLSIAKRALNEKFSELYPDQQLMFFFHVKLSTFFDQPKSFEYNWFREEVDMLVLLRTKDSYGREAYKARHVIASATNHSEQKKEYFEQRGCTYHSLNFNFLKVNPESLFIEIRRRAMTPNTKEFDLDLKDNGEFDLINKLREHLDAEAFEIFPEISLNSVFRPKDYEKEKLRTLTHNLNQKLRSSAKNIAEIAPIGNLLATTTIDILIGTSKTPSVPLLGIELDGSVHYPNEATSPDSELESEKKLCKDQIKNRIFRNSGVPLLRVKSFGNKTNTDAFLDSDHVTLISLAAAGAVSELQNEMHRIFRTKLNILRTFVEDYAPWPLQDDLSAIILSLEDDTEAEIHQPEIAEIQRRYDEDMEIQWVTEKWRYLDHALDLVDDDPIELFLPSFRLIPNKENVQYSQLDLVLEPNRICTEAGVERFHVNFPEKVGFRLISEDREVKKVVNQAILDSLSSFLKIRAQEFLGQREIREKIRNKLSRFKEESP